jgi:hypothetical protein
MTRIFRETFESCDSANGQQRDVSRADAVMFRGQGMPELMQQHTSKKRDDESDAKPWPRPNRDPDQGARTESIRAAGRTSNAVVGILRRNDLVQALAKVVETQAWVM